MPYDKQNLTKLKSGALGGMLSGFPEHARLIGMLVTEWNTIESGLVMVLSFAMGNQWNLIYPMIYALRNSAARIDVMEPALLTLCEKHGKDMVELKEIIKEARKVCKARNTYAHALYANSDGKLTMLALEEGIAGLSKPENRKILEVKELEEAVWRSTALSNRVSAFMMDRPIEEPPR